MKAEMNKIPYASVVGSLMYGMVYIRPNIAYDVRVVNLFMSNPGKEHWTTVSRIHVCACETKAGPWGPRAEEFKKRKKNKEVGRGV